MEYYFTDGWKQVLDPDFEHYRVEDGSVDLYAAFDVEQEEVGHEEPITYYVTLPDGTRQEIDASTVDDVPEYTTGVDVRYVVDTEQQGCWKYFRDDGSTLWEDCPVEPFEWWSKGQAYSFSLPYHRLIKYTDAELQEQQEEQAEQAEQEAAAEAQHEVMDSLPDALAELSECVSDNQVNVSDLSDAIAELAALVSDMLESGE